MSTRPTYREILQNSSGGEYAARVTAEHDDHEAWVSVFKIPVSYFRNRYYKERYHTATHVVRWVEIHHRLLKTTNAGYSNLWYDLATTYHMWMVDSEEKACEILSQYITDDTLFLEASHPEINYPKFNP